MIFERITTDPISLSLSFSERGQLVSATEGGHLEGSWSLFEGQENQSPRNRILVRVWRGQLEVRGVLGRSKTKPKEFYNERDCYKGPRTNFGGGAKSQYFAHRKGEQLELVNRQLKGRRKTLGLLLGCI